MKKAIYILIAILCFALTMGCSKKEKIKKQRTIDSKDNTTIQEVEKVNNINVIIEDKTYSLILEENEAAKHFSNQLPLEITMEELNGNEKYVYLDSTFPKKEETPHHINAGDVMLYGDNCLVIFYKFFDTSYSYTKIGHINNLPDLGSNRIKASFYE